MHNNSTILLPYSTTNVAPVVCKLQICANTPKMTGGNGPSWNQTPQFIAPLHSSKLKCNICKHHNLFITLLLGSIRGSCKKFFHWAWITSVLRFIKHVFITNLQSIPLLLKHIFVTFLPSCEKQIKSIFGICWRH